MGKAGKSRSRHPIALFLEDVFGNQSLRDGFAGYRVLHSLLDAGARGKRKDAKAGRQQNLNDAGGLGTAPRRAPFSEAEMIVFIIAAIMAFGGYAITIPLLIHDEWVQWRARSQERKSSFFRRNNAQTEVQAWDSMATT